MHCYWSVKLHLYRKDKKSQRSHKTVGFKGFIYYFCLMIEKSVSGRPKNIQILRIPIRNTTRMTKVQTMQRTVEKVCMMQRCVSKCSICGLGRGAKPMQAVLPTPRQIFRPVKKLTVKYYTRKYSKGWGKLFKNNAKLAHMTGCMASNYE
jgi:hypothetical protein